MGRLLNVTIDDTLGDNLSGAKPEYKGKDWRLRSVGDTPCTVCSAQPDPTFAVNGTWHDQLTFSGEEPATISFTFSGTAVYVFCIVPNGIPLTPINVTRLSFYLDDSLSGGYLHLVDRTLDQYLYNQLAFNRQGLTAGNHTLRIANQPADTGSLILFDYAVYTTEVSDAPVSVASPSAEVTVSDTSAASPSETPASVSAHVGVDAHHQAAIVVGMFVGAGFVVLFMLVIISRWLRQSALGAVPQPYVPPVAMHQ
ncbi:hypothetical protein AURDEDRAFT_175146 [Auricularia subglabra TFB-10046 SS5]|nr:hypothetical protein AURDEDRAFT_175146 [Auricularia subglabra TFB-10046 SS5]